jgi:hypothetical protein
VRMVLTGCLWGGVLLWCLEWVSVRQAQGEALTCRRLCCCCSCCKGDVDKRLCPLSAASSRALFSCIQRWSSNATCSKPRTSWAAAKLWERREGLLGPSSAPWALFSLKKAS